MPEPAPPANGNLPAIVTATELDATNPDPPADIIPGVFHRQGKLALGGGSKTHKSWILADLALSVAAGVPWLKWPTVQGRCLYINFEIHAGFFVRRLRAIALAKGIPMPPLLQVWNLRGYAAGYTELLPRIYSEVKKQEPFSAIITDPMYKLYGDTDENSAADVAKLFNGLEELAVKTGAGTVFGTHFSKGNQAQKDAIDRISGSGVFGRDPDTILNMTPHEEAGCFAVDITLRNYAPQAAFVIRWEMPLMRVEGAHDPSKLRKTGGRPVKFSVSDLIEVLRVGGPFVNVKDFCHACEVEMGISRARFYALLNILKKSPEARREGHGWAFVGG